MQIAKSKVEQQLQWDVQLSWIGLNDCSAQQTVAAGSMSLGTALYAVT